MLESIKVLSFTHYLQGPMTAQALAYMGADVIKIESHKGAFERSWSGADSYINGESVYFFTVDRNQRSISIDLKSEAGKQIVYDLVKTADVVIENFRPGVMERLGFGYEALKDINKRIIYCSCSGFGSSGPYQYRPGQDLISQAMTGLLTISGRKTDPPLPMGTASSDQHAARLDTVGILAALIEREKTGEGMMVEGSLMGAALDLQREPLTYHINGFELYEKSPSGIGSRFHEAPYGVYKTKDGYICVSMTQTDKLAEVFEDESFLIYKENDQFIKREEINEKVAAHILQKTTSEWAALLPEHDIWCSLINDYEEVVRDPQVKWNESIEEFEHPVAGRIKVLAHPVKYNGKRLKARMLPPNLGGNTSEILNELGYSDAKIDELIASGIVKQGEK